MLIEVNFLELELIKILDDLNSQKKKNKFHKQAKVHSLNVLVFLLATC